MIHHLVQVEKCIQTELPKHVLSTDKGSFKQDVIDKITVDSDAQFYWAILSQEI